MKKTRVGVFAVTALVLVGCSSEPEKAEPIDFTGMLALNQVMIRPDIDERGGCVGKDGFSDIREGVSVLISDKSGEPLVKTKLNQGRPKDNFTCTFRFTAEVPGGEDFYTVQVAARNKMTYTGEEMKAGIQMSLS
ncbi:hypothetical protein [Rhodococcus sp. KB6]|uniref:hypothetical protein n=1 Tax=Rhodococcus sp. KB6 TaxID=1752066 RepID=UPI000717ED80|nr:hypothetical protein [Rhodococcus sp. KB6]